MRPLHPGELRITIAAGDRIGQDGREDVLGRVRDEGPPDGAGKEEALDLPIGLGEVNPTQGLVSP